MYLLYLMHFQKATAFRKKEHLHMQALFFV